MWNLRQSLTRYASRWPWMAAFILLGAFLGWGAARLAPPQYRASAELYVGLHAYRAPEENDRNPSSYYDFRNLDDFKNWQLEQLDQFVRRDEIITGTLARLRTQDAAWETVTPAALQAMLTPEWRTVGKWQLTAAAPAPRMAEQAAETWRAVTLEALESAMQSAAEVMRLDVEMQALAEAQLARPEERETLQARMDALMEQYRAADAASHGLSLNLSLDGISTLPVRARAVRSTGAWTLAGALLGLLGVILLWLFALGMEEPGHD